MLYRLAVETGLRAGELRSLKVASFDLDHCTLTLEAAYSKHRRQDTIPFAARYGGGPAGIPVGKNAPGGGVPHAGCG